jgi:4-methyl-5(b-hydroxyethyl)-thiazole monophosphate biosynthesis
MAKVYEFLANGFEEIEGLAPVDILRRGGVDIKTVSVTGSEFVETSHGVTIKADLRFEDVESFEDADMLMIPGGMPGSTDLNEHEGVRQALIAQHRHPRRQESYLLSWFRTVFQCQHRIYRHPLPGRWQCDYR